MNTNKTNTGMNVDDYEDMAVQNSNVAKRVAVGSAVFLGGAAVAGGAAYAANHSQEEETPLTEDEFLGGAEVGSDFKPTEETTTTEQVVVEKPITVAASEPKPEEPLITWDETTTFYNGDEKAMTMEQGTVEGHKFVLVDENGDNHADYLMVDVNDDGKFDADEIVKYQYSDHVHMGHDTAHTTEHHFNTGFNVDENDPNYIAQRDPAIHNDFEDEKTGEDYQGDYAENNPDYNSHASLNESRDNNYLAERTPGTEENVDVYGTADIDGIQNDDHDLAQTDTSLEVDDNSTSYEEEMEDTSDSYDSMMGGDEFLA